MGSKLLDAFRYEYKEIMQTVVPTQSIQTRVSSVRRGQGVPKTIRRLKWPWQRPSTATRRVVLLSPGHYFTGSITMEPWEQLRASDNVSIRGTGRGTTIRGSDGTYHVFPGVSLQDAMDACASQAEPEPFPIIVEPGVYPESD